MAHVDPPCSRIDVHHHFSPPEYIRALDSNSELKHQQRNWTVESDVEQMEEGGVELSIISITTPGLWFGDDGGARRLARLCNEYAAQLAADYPHRFGIFVNLPLPDIDGALRELEYGLDVLKADGVAVFTSYGSTWFGDPRLNPLYEELNRRKAVVFAHPTVISCCCNLLDHVSDSLIEYAADTTRAITTMLLRGTAARFPDMRVIWSHGGGMLPFLAYRYDALARNPQFKPHFPNGLKPELNRFHYDTAMVATRPALLALSSLIETRNLLFGSDVPFGTSASHARGLAESGVFDTDALQAIDRGNAMKVFARYA